MYRLRIKLFAMAALLAAGCVNDDLDSYNPNPDERVDYEDYREPADLTVVVDMEQLMADFEQNGPVTRVDGTSAQLRWSNEMTLGEISNATQDSASIYYDPTGERYGAVIDHREIAAYNSANADEQSKFWDDSTNPDSHGHTDKKSKQGERIAQGHKRFDTEEISSLAFFLVDMQANADGSHPRSWGRIVAYRLFLSPNSGEWDAAGNKVLLEEDITVTVPDGITDEKYQSKYFFYDLDNIAGHETQTEDYIDQHISLGGRTYTDKDGATQYYTYGDDFCGKITPGADGKWQVPATGLNGYAAMANGELIPDDAANDKGWGNGFYRFDYEYDESSSKAVIMSFKHDHPLHETKNDMEKLRRGDVWVMAVANFHTLPTTYKGHPFGFWIKEVIDYWHRHKNDNDFYGIPANPVADPNYSYVYNPIVQNDGMEQYTNKNVTISGHQFREVTGAFCGYREMADAGVRHNDSQLTNNNNKIQTMTIGGGTKIRHYKPMILSSNDYRSALAPGENVFHRRLVRLPSRVTFSIANHSEEKLTVENFALSDNFAQSAAWIFSHAPTPYQSVSLGNYFENWRGGAVDVWSNKALVPFRVRSYDRMDTPDIFFDALTYESGPQLGTTVASPMTYDITLAYQGVTINREASISVADDDTTLSEMEAMLGSSDWAVGTSKTFLLRSSRPRYPYPFYMTDNGIASTNMNVRYPGTNAQFLIDILNALTPDVEAGRANDYIWYIEKVTTSSVRIKSYTTDQYLRVPTSMDGSFRYTDDASLAAVFKLDKSPSDKYAGEDGIRFETTISGKTAYLFTKQNTTGTGAIICSDDDIEAGAHTTPYLVTITEGYSGPLRKTLTNVPIKVFDGINGLSETLTEIKRNDHVNVEISVTYNTEREDIEFEVRNWATSDNDLSFD